MKLSVEFPSVVYREGPEQVARLARAIEEIGYDQLDMFDHVVMGFPTDVRPAPIYPPQMPIMEAIVVLSFAAAVTSRIGLGTEVLVLPQRQPVLVAKQISTLDTLSAGRVRLGVGVGWQASEFQALGEDFSNRGRRMDEAIDLLRACWGESHIEARETSTTTCTRWPWSPSRHRVSGCRSGSAAPQQRRCSASAKEATAGWRTRLPAMRLPAMR